jgi:hypothetical protein
MVARRSLRLRTADVPAPLAAPRRPGPRPAAAQKQPPVLTGGCLALADARLVGDPEEEGEASSTYLPARAAPAGCGGAGG